LGVTITDAAANTGAEWPFFTMSNLGVFTQDLIEDDPATLLVYSPLVSQEHRLEWESYSVQHQALVTTDVAPDEFLLPAPPRPNISDSIFRYVKETPIDEPESSPGPFSPAWQVTPVPSGANISVVNLNLLSNRIFDRLAGAAYMTRTSVVSTLEEPQDLLGIPVYPTQRYQVGPKEDPQYLAVQPIFGDFRKVANIVGYMTGTQPWKSLLSGIIATDGSNDKVDVSCVVADSCTGQSFTFWINGSDTVYAGAGDLHETSYDGMKATSVVASYTLHLNNTEESTQQAGQKGLSWDSCFVELSIYPTSTMEASFDSGAPVAYLLLILSLSGILIMAFATHNKAVDQRHQELQAKSRRSNAIIATLFPDQIRDKLFGQDGAVKEDGLRLLNSGAQQSIDALLKSENSCAPGILGFDDDSFLQKQIAELFPNCTCSKRRLPS
jgi:hypothetical protein